MDKNLDCCVVRDLLPAYLEELTEAETSAQVRAHLENCEACRAMEADMRARVPVEKAPKRALRFLKRVKRTRLIAAALTLALTLWLMWAMYDGEYHYPNTEAGRLAAVEEFVVGPPWESSVGSSVPIHSVAWQELGDQLLVFYKADTSNNIHGILTLERGMNGKYAAVHSMEDPSSLRAGLYAEELRLDGERYFYLGGYNCREIYSAQVRYVGHNFDGNERQYTERTYTCAETDFLWLWEYEEMVRELGWEYGMEDGQVCWLTVEDIRLLDREGNDITLRYTNQNGSGEERGGGGKGKAERGLLYVWMGVAAVLGGIFIQYFLRRD